MTSRAGQNHRDCFCYICGEYKTVNNRKSITDFVQKEFYAYHWNKARISRQTMGSSCCLQDMCTCLRQWTKGPRPSMGFGKPMVWKEPTNHVDNCYFCSINVTVVNKK